MSNSKQVPCPMLVQSLDKRGWDRTSNETLSRTGSLEDLWARGLCVESCHLACELTWRTHGVSEEWKGRVLRITSSGPSIRTLRRFLRKRGAARRDVHRTGTLVDYSLFNDLRDRAGQTPLMNLRYTSWTLHFVFLSLRAKLVAKNELHFRPQPERDVVQVLSHG
jgi:hypothetical protein